MKKRTIAIIIVIFIVIPIGLWVKDIFDDRSNIVTTLDNVALYSNWNCGLNCTKKDEIIKIPIGKKLNVLRIRYGKDFMAIKVEYQQDTGWLIYNSRQIQIIKLTT